MQVNQQLPGWSTKPLDEKQLFQSVWRFFFESIWNRTGGGTGGGVTPPGGVIFWAGTIGIPDGFLACNGQSLSATSYPALASALGASGTFSVPNIPNYNGLIAIIRWQT